MSPSGPDVGSQEIGFDGDMIESLTVTVEGVTRAGRKFTINVPRLDFTGHGHDRIDNDGHPEHCLVWTLDREYARVAGLRRPQDYVNGFVGDTRLGLLIRGAVPNLEPGEAAYVLTVTDPPNGDTE